MRDGPESVVDVELRGHERKARAVDRGDGRRQGERGPRRVLAKEELEERKAGEQGLKEKLYNQTLHGLE